MVVSEKPKKKRPTIQPNKHNNKNSPIYNLIRQRLTGLGELSEEPDQFTQIEAKRLEDEQKIAEKRLDLRFKEQELKFREKEHQERIDYAKKMYGLMRVWLMAIAALILANGLSVLDNFFVLSDSILMTILTTTTVTVIGLFATVLRYLFVSHTP